MLNPFREVNWQPDTAARRAFAKSLMIGFPCVALGLLLVGKLTSGAWSLEFALKLGVLGAAAGVLFHLVPAIAKPFYVVWYALACCVGLVMGNVLMGLLFYVLVTGIGLVKRAFGSQPIRKTVDRQAATYWHTAPPPPAANRYYRQY
ncbi:MAG: Saxitoxin biosynthesis operon protein SxtJ [Verrucomicrobiota bacterium]|jgi:hypothetical protein